MHVSRRLLFGSLLILVGLVFLGETTGIIVLDALKDFFWPVVLIALGVWFLLRRYRHRWPQGEKGDVPAEAEPSQMLGDEKVQ